jgi:hypothetical protein
MRAKCVLTLTSGLLLAQCASQPTETAPVSISPIQYQSYTCPQLGQQAESLSAKEAELSSAQDRRSAKLSVPFLRADEQETNTRLTLIKAQIKAIEQARTDKKCR